MEIPEIESFRWVADGLEVNGHRFVDHKLAEQLRDAHERVLKSYEKLLSEHGR